MKNLCLAICLLFFSGLHADWQAAKQKAKKIGATIADSVNVGKYRRLLEQAQAELHTCVLNSCRFESDEYNREIRKRGVSVASREAWKKYLTCRDKHCSEQVALAIKRIDSVNKRTKGIILGTYGVAFGTVLVGGMAAMGTAAAAEGYDSMKSNQRLGQFLEITRHYEKQYGLNMAQQELFQTIVRENQNNKKLNTRWLTALLKKYILDNNILDIQEDNFIQAVADYTKQDISELVLQLGIGAWNNNPLYQAGD